MAKNNGLISAEDYVKALEERVTLPSGHTFLLRKPTLGFRIVHVNFGQSIAARAGDAPTDASSDRDQEIKNLVATYYDILCEACASPKVSLTPQEGELHPDKIQLPDAIFIARWAGGEVDAQGADLAKFRDGESRASAAAGAGGGDVPPVAERSAGDGPDGFPV